MRVLLDCKIRLKQSYCFATRSRESAAWIRSSFQQAPVEKLSFLGIGLNELRNADTAELIFSDASQFKFSVIRTDEELMIARSVWRIPRTALESAELNELDRFHFVMDTIDRLPHTGDKGITLKQQLKNKLIEHKQYIDKHGQDMPEIRNWKWKG